MEELSYAWWILLDHFRSRRHGTFAVQKKNFITSLTRRLCYNLDSSSATSRSATSWNVRVTQKIMCGFGAACGLLSVQGYIIIAYIMHTHRHAYFRTHRRLSAVAPLDVVHEVGQRRHGTPCPSRCRTAPGRCACTRSRSTCCSAPATWPTRAAASPPVPPCSATRPRFLFVVLGDASKTAAPPQTAQT